MLLYLCGDQMSASNISDVGETFGLFIWIFSLILYKKRKEHLDNDVTLELGVIDALIIMALEGPYNDSKTIIKLVCAMK